MGLGISIFLVALGAILAWGVTVDTRGFDLDAVGVILMVVGGLGFLASLAFWSSWGGFGGRTRETVVDEPDHHRHIA